MGHFHKEAEESLCMIMCNGSVTGGQRAGPASIAEDTWCLGQACSGLDCYDNEDTYNDCDVLVFLGIFFVFRSVENCF